jgi:hypothetical protein
MRVHYQWNREVADVRVHVTTGKLPIIRFAQEVGALRPLSGRAPFGQLRDRSRHQLLRALASGRRDRPVVVLAGRVIVRPAGAVVAYHPVCDGRRHRLSIEPTWPGW